LVPLSQVKRLSCICKAKQIEIASPFFFIPLEPGVE